MSTITTRAGKGTPLTHTEVYANFTNLNSDKYEAGESVTAEWVRKAIDGGRETNASLTRMRIARHMFRRFYGAVPLVVIGIGRVLNN